MPLDLVKKGKVYHVDGRINGRRYRQSTRTRDRPRAEAFRRKLERDLEDRAYLGADAAIFADAVAIYIEKGGEGAHLRPLLEKFEAFKLKDITPAEVSRFAQARFAHMQPPSVKRYLYTPLNAIMRAAHRAQLAPLVRFDPPKFKRKPVEYADNHWLRTFLEFAHPRLALIVMFMTLTGTRVSEACRVTVGDVDLQRGTAVLRRTKNGKSRRVPLPPLLVGALRQWALGKARTAPLFGYSGRWSVNQAIERTCAKASPHTRSAATPSPRDS